MLASTGAAATANVNGGTPYVVSVGGASGSTFTAGNYSISYQNGALTVTPAALTVTANDATKVRDGAAWKDGNGVRYSGFVGGDTAAALAGVLSWSGDSQGAIEAGRYVITPGGLSSANYQIQFRDGALVITAVPTATASLPSGGVLASAGMIGVIPSAPPSIAPIGGAGAGGATANGSANPGGSTAGLVESGGQNGAADAGGTGASGSTGGTGSTNQRAVVVGSPGFIDTGIPFLSMMTNAIPLGAASSTGEGAL